VSLTKVASSFFRSLTMAARSGEFGVGWGCLVDSSSSVSIAMGGGGVAVRDAIADLNCSTAVVSIFLSSLMSDLIARSSVA